MNQFTDKKKIILLHWNGRFGNRMFTYAFLRHYAEEFNLSLWLPSSWEGDTPFQNKPHRIIDDDELRLYLNQTIKELDNIDARMNAVYNYNRRSGDEIVYLNPDSSKIEGHKQFNGCIRNKTHSFDIRHSVFDIRRSISHVKYITRIGLANCRRTLKTLDLDILGIEQAMDELIRTDPRLAEQVKLATSVTGIGKNCGNQYDHCHRRIH